MVTEKKNDVNGFGHHYVETLDGNMCVCVCQVNEYPMNTAGSTTLTLPDPHDFSVPRLVESTTKLTAW